jgi:hypothetical protein
MFAPSVQLPCARENFLCKRVKNTASLGGLFAPILAFTTHPLDTVMADEYRRTPRAFRNLLYDEHLTKHVSHVLTAKYEEYQIHFYSTNMVECNHLDHLIPRNRHAIEFRAYKTQRPSSSYGSQPHHRTTNLMHTAHSRQRK